MHEHSPDPRTSAAILGRALLSGLINGDNVKVELRGFLTQHGNSPDPDIGELEYLLVHYPVGGSAADIEECIRRLRGEEPH